MKAYLLEKIILKSPLVLLSKRGVELDAFFETRLLLLKHESSVVQFLRLHGLGEKAILESLRLAGSGPVTLTNLSGNPAFVITKKLDMLN